MHLTVESSDFDIWLTCEGYVIDWMVWWCETSKLKWSFEFHQFRFINVCDIISLFHCFIHSIKMTEMIATKSKHSLNFSKKMIKIELTFQKSRIKVAQIRKQNNGKIKKFVYCHARYPFFSCTRSNVLKFVIRLIVTQRHTHWMHWQHHTIPYYSWLLTRLSLTPPSQTTRP